MKACATPSATLGLDGVISIETSVGLVTVKIVLAEIPESACVAVIVVLPIAALVARPLLPEALLMLATLLAEEDQVTALVMSCTVASVYVPIAVKLWVSPSAKDRLVGVTSIETSVAGVTSKLVLAETPESTCVAVIVVVPTLSELASPREPLSWLTVATPSTEDVH